MNNKIKNTSKSPNPEWLMGGNPNAIEAQEAQGQTELVNSDVLPVDMGTHSEHNHKKILKGYGFKFLGVVEGDVLFQNVKMPKGWKKVATDHSMHSDLVDEKGRKRANIFYKAAFYDRKAHLDLSRRYRYDIDYDKLNKGVTICRVKDHDDSVLFSTIEHTMTEEEKEKSWNVTDEHNKIAREWLNKTYPDWENPSKYWD